MTTFPIPAPVVSGLMVGLIIRVHMLSQHSSSRAILVGWGV